MVIRFPLSYFSCVDRSSRTYKPPHLPLPTITSTRIPLRPALERLSTSVLVHPDPRECALLRVSCRSCYPPVRPLPLCTQDSAVTETMPTWSISVVRLCCVRIAFPPSQPTGLAPRRLGTHPLLYFEVLYLFQYFPRLSPPSSGTSLGQVVRRLERIEAMVQSVGLNVELPIVDPRLPACVNVEWEVSRISTTRRILGATERTFKMVFFLSALIGNYIIVDHPKNLHP